MRHFCPGKKLSSGSPESWQPRSTSASLSAMSNMAALLLDLGFGHHLRARVPQPGEARPQHVAHLFEVVASHLVSVALHVDLYGRLLAWQADRPIPFMPHMELHSPVLSSSRPPC